MPYRHYGRWRARWVDENGVQQSETFDDFKSAERHERKKKAEVCEIKEGLRQPGPPVKTFDDLADYWMENRAPRKRSRKDDESLIKKHLRPAFGTMRLRELGTEDIDAFVNAKIDDEELSEKYTHNMVTLLGTMLRAATFFKVPWLLVVPKINKPKVSLFSRDYCWLRTDEEVRRFLVAARAEGEWVFVLYAVAIYTGMRAGEIAALEWPDVDFDRRLITVQRSFDGPTKSDRVRYVPILDALLPILRAWRLRHPGQLVFTSMAGTMFTPSGRIFQEVLHRGARARIVLDAAGFPKVTRNGRERHYIRFHDLRHTFASHWTMKGGDLFRLQKILGHASVSMTLRYSHLSPSAFADDYGRMTVLAIESGEVIPLKRQGQN
jgi:integrase